MKETETLQVCKIWSIFLSLYEKYLRTKEKIEL